MTAPQRDMAAIRAEIVTTALEIACYPATRASKWSPQCYVSWRLIWRLRALFAEANVDWKALKAKVDAGT